MPVAVGSVVEGTVIKLLRHGVVIKLPDGGTGLVHISEIDDRFVSDVNEYFRMNDPVEVKVIGQDERGLSLSVKKAKNGAGPELEAKPRPRISDEERASFDEKLSYFMKQSNERQLDVRRNRESKLGGKRGR